MIETKFPNRATPTGSTPYYVIRFSPADQQDKLAALFLFKEEMEKLYIVSDPGVARIKLQWWLEQISLPADSPSEHQLANALSFIYHHSETAREAFKSYLAEIDRHLHRQAYNDIQEMWQGCINTGGSFAALIEQVSGNPVSAQTSQIGAWITFIEWLQNLGQTIRLNVNLLPISLLEHFEISQHALLKPDNQDMVETLILDLVSEAESLAEIPMIRRAKTPLTKYFKLRNKLLKLLEDESYAVMQQRISLTPFRKLWLAF